MIKFIEDKKYLTDIDYKAISENIAYLDICQLRICADTDQEGFDIMENLSKRFAIYQYNTNDFHNYDLFTWYNIKNGKKDLTYFILTINDNHKELNYEQLFSILKSIDSQAKCYIQYNAYYNDEKLFQYVNDFYKNNENRFIKYCNGFSEQIGRLKKVNNQYGFFKKRANKYYIPLNNKQIYATCTEISEN